MSLRIWAGLFLTAVSLHAAHLEVVQISGASLRDNALGDPPDRPVAVFSPDAVEAGARLPLVIYLPGWGGSSQQAITEGAGSLMARAVDALAARKLPLRIAVVDGRSRYGGSQFLNSTATGRYADYVSTDVFGRLAPTLSRFRRLPHRRALQRRVRRAHAGDARARKVRRRSRAFAGQRFRSDPPAAGP